MIPGSALLKKRVVTLTIYFMAGLILSDNGYAQIQYNMERGGSAEDRKKLEEQILTAVKYAATDVDSALRLLEEARSHGLFINDSDAVASAWLHTAFLYIYKGQHEKAKVILDRTRHYCLRKTRSLPLSLHWYKTAGNMYTIRGAHDSAFICHINGLELSRKRGYTEGEISFNLDIAANWISNRQFDKALPHIKKAEGLAITGNMRSYLATAYINYALAYNGLGNTAGLLLYTNKILALPGSDKRVKRQALVLAGVHAQTQGNYTEAVRYGLEAVKLGDTGNPTNLLDPYYILCASYYRLGDLARAAAYGGQALKILERDEYIGYANADLFKSMASVYQELKDYPNAFLCMSHYARLSDSLHLAARNNAVDKIEARYRLAEKDRLLLQQQAKVRNRDTWIAITMAIVCITVLISVLLYRNARKKVYILRQQKEIDRLKAMAAGEEKERSRLARELHDGVGGLLSAAVMNLDSIGDRHALLPEDPAFARMGALVYEISNEVRNIAHNLSPDILRFHDLPEAVELFCANIQEGTGISIEVVATGDFKTLGADLVLSSYRIIQELLQNIMKHAGATEVLVQLQRSRSLLSITVEDNGTGYDEADKPRGIGLNNIRSRVKSHYCKISINSIVGKGTSVYIEFDLEKEQKHPV